MVRFKEGVSLFGLKPEILASLPVVVAVCEEYDVECVVTSGVEGKHSVGSLHYQGLAMDFRTRDLPDDKKTSFADTIFYRLNGMSRRDASNKVPYDVVLEKTHLHVEYQRKV